MPTVDTIVGTPSQAECGDTVIFSEQFADYPVADWTNAFLLVLGNGTPVSTASTTSGATFLTTLSAAVTAALPPGVYSYAHHVSSGGQRVTAKVGKITFLPNLAVAQTASFAAAQVALLKVVLAEFGATSRASVSFNGQSFSRANVGDYQKQLVYFQAVVIQEQRAVDAARGVSTGGRIANKFVNPNS